MFVRRLSGWVVEKPFGALYLDFLLCMRSKPVDWFDGKVVMAAIDSSQYFPEEGGTVIH